jgi:hypothetical protein
MVTRAIVQILTPLALSKREDGRLVMDLWKHYIPDLLPDVYGNWEPLDRPFQLSNIESLLDAWKWPFLTLRHTPSVESNIWMRKGSQRLHATWVLSLEASAANQTKLLAFLKAAGSALRADFAYLHLLTPSELERGRASKTALPLNKQATRFTFLVSSKDLQQRIPDMFWATMFGAPYLEMFGEDLLLTAPAFKAEALPGRGVLLQITEELADVERRSSVFENTRALVKKYLGEDVFFEEGRKPIDGYRTPAFTFS